MGARAVALSLLMLVQPMAASELPPTFRRSFSRHATALRAELLDGYDKVVPPTSNRSSEYQSKAGTDVGLQIRLFKVESVKQTEGQMRLKVWYRLSWVDERLSWDPAEHGGITMLQFLGHSVNTPEDTEIWLPDLQPYNAKEGIYHTLEPSIVQLLSDGSAYHPRPGMLDVLCKFSGLVAFPYDRLKCTLEIGGWMYSGAFQGIHLVGDGYEIDFQEATSGSSYQEFSFSHVQASLTNYEYACCPNEPWPVAQYELTLNRASYYYEFSILVPTAILCMTSFMVFGMSHAVGERLSFGITLVLAMVVQQTFVSAVLPVCGELLWVEIYFFYSFIFSIIALLETCAVLFFAFHTEPHVIPHWLVDVASTTIYQPLCRLATSCASRWRQRRESSRSSTLRETARMSVAGRPHRPRKEFEQRARVTAEQESCAASLYRRMAAAHAKTLPPAPPTVGGEAERPAEAGAKAIAFKDVRTGEGEERELIATRAPTKDDAAKFVFFESLFFLVDESAKGWISVGEANHLFSFMALQADEEQRLYALMRADRWDDGQLLRGEFCELCVELLWGIEISQLQMAASNYQSSASMFKRRNVAYWRRVSKQIDWWARFTVPPLYLTGLIMLFYLELSDPYGTGEPAAMYSGLGNVSVGTGGWIFLTMALLCWLSIVIAYLVFRRVAIQRKLLHDERMGWRRLKEKESFQKKMGSESGRRKDRSGRSVFDFATASGPLSSSRRRPTGPARDNSLSELTAGMGTPAPNGGPSEVALQLAVAGTAKPAERNGSAATRPGQRDAIAATVESPNHRRPARVSADARPGDIVAQSREASSGSGGGSSSCETDEAGMAAGNRSLRAHGAAGGGHMDGKQDAVAADRLSVHQTSDDRWMAAAAAGGRGQAMYL